MTRGEHRLRGEVIERLLDLPCEARNRWEIFPKAPMSELKGVPGVHPLAVQVLYNRGIQGPDAVGAFLSGGQVPLSDATVMKGMPEAVARLKRAVAEREPVVVYGDYDADGVTSTTLLVGCLRALKLPTTFFVPDRYRHGYGLNRAAIDEICQRGARLIVAVDCGISAVSEVAYARELGIDVVVLDHHHVPPVLPDARAVVNPHQDGCLYPFKDLCGVGLAHRFAQALFAELGRDPGLADQWLDLVALGTVADIVPLLGENRVLVARGLAAMKRAPRPGVRAMIESAALKGAITAHTIGYILGPRLNAPGRLATAELSLKLLAATDEKEASALARKLSEVNQERQQLTEQMCRHAEEILQVRGELSKLIFVSSEDFKSGLVGLVAGRLKEEYCRPVLVAQEDGKVAHGSARSIDAFHVTEALAACQDLLTRFGGHAHAAGFTVPRENLGALRQRLEDLAAKQIPDAALQPTLYADAEVRLDRVGPSIIDSLEALEPFGQGNPSPSFVSRGLKVVWRGTVGAEQQHLKLRLWDGTRAWEAIGWRLADRPIGDVIDIAYAFERHAWNGTTTTRLLLVDFQGST
ncbi:MAG TPA: single-stranded-DNA-specific exonuclease RecJ [Chloroflexota bacterium]|nr:single-stranded-DNA-specific exonuclease RecJ [Chloroflexota bacterium]